MLKQICTGIQVLILIAVLVIQAAGPLCCVAKDAECCAVTEAADGSSSHGCCVDEEEGEEVPSCCFENVPPPQMLSVVEKFQQPELLEADLSDWGIPGRKHLSLAEGVNRRFFVGVDPPPGRSVLTTRLCVRQI